MAEPAMKTCQAAKGEGNAAYTAGDLEVAASCYSSALSFWEEAVALVPQPKTLEVGNMVRYDNKGFGQVMSAFAMFDEYFLKDLGTDTPIWVGDVGGTLKRFCRKDLEVVTTELLDLRCALLSNLAAVRLKGDNWREASHWAEQALAVDGKAPKALMRKGAALLRDGQPGPASDVLKAAEKQNPKDPEVRRLLRQSVLQRSPNWVCVTGCCGPWGIVCGGPVSTIMPQVVLPAKRPEAAFSTESVSTDLGPEGSDGEQDADDDDGSSSCSSSAPSSPRMTKIWQPGPLIKLPAPTNVATPAETAAQQMPQAGPNTGAKAEEAAAGGVAAGCGEDMCADKECGRATAQEPAAVAASAGCGEERCRDKKCGKAKRNSSGVSVEESLASGSAEGAEERAAVSSSLEEKQLPEVLAKVLPAEELRGKDRSGKTSTTAVGRCWVVTAASALLIGVLAAGVLGATGPGLNPPV